MAEARRKRGSGTWMRALGVGLLLPGIALGGQKPEDPQALAIGALGAGAVVSVDQRGEPTFLRGDLGRLERGDEGEAARAFLLSMDEVFGMVGDEDFELLDVVEDDLGRIHIKMRETIRGLPVEGAELIVHAWAGSRRVYAINGHVAPAEGVAAAPSLPAARALRLGVQSGGFDSASILDAPILSYVLSPSGDIHLAWSARIQYENSEGPQRDRIFVDAASGEVVTRYPEIFRSLYRKIYTANNGTSLPGTLLFVEGGSSSDAIAMAAYDNSGFVYNYYQTVHNRDSYDNAGAQLVSSVHVGTNYNNAYWDGTQMAYGDGDGTTFSPFAQSYDVVAHELTHAVTQETANLTYSYESGALNEAFSDIFGAASEAWLDGSVNADTWMIGEDCYTPSTAGDALRYMDNPTADGQSYDYYPERYTGSQDNGGVHLNSGIANLAFVLLTDGGTHPRNKTNVNVPAQGLDVSEQVFYRALTTYMTSSTNFEGARNATAQAAADLYGQSVVDAVHLAWDAVGVPGGPIQVDTLNNGVPISGLSGSTGAEDYFVISVPSGATDLTIAISGGSGDADLYVQYGSMPTTSSYDCRPYKWGNSESCSWTSPTAGDWYIMLRGYSSYSGVTLSGDYTGGGANQAPIASYSYSVSGLTVSFTDGSSDPDGTIVSRSWDFGDGTSSTSTNPSHTYGTDGTYTVTLTVTDDAGAVDSSAQAVTVSAPVNQAPTAAFSYTTSGLTASFTDGSSDPDGTIVSRSWDFGDGTSSTSTNPSHTYGTDGTYTVTLTVTDDAGAVDSSSTSVTVSATSAPCSNCEYYSGSLTGSGDWDAQPNGTYYYSATSGMHEAWLEGPAGSDYDLRLYKWSSWGYWYQVASSLSYTSSESISYSGSAGYYYWKIESYSGSGAYDFWMNRP